MAEAAVTVADEMQGRRVAAGFLLQALARAARSAGCARSFRGTVLAENAGMRRLLQEAGARVLPEDGATLVFDVTVDGAPEGADKGVEHPLLRLLRAMAASLGWKPAEPAAAEPSPAAEAPAEVAGKEADAPTGG